MSRMGKKPIAISDKVKAELKDGSITITGPKGTLSQAIENSNIEIAINADNIVVSRSSEQKETRAMHGLYRALVKNMVEGVENGYSKDLELVGVGYRVKKEGKNLNFSLGFSHPVIFECPEGIQFDLDGQTKIKVSGIDKELVGRTTANIIKLRKPDAYKGKGVRLVGQVIKLKAGKSVKK